MMGSRSRRWAHIGRGWPSHETMTAPIHPPPWWRCHKGTPSRNRSTVTVEWDDRRSLSQVMAIHGHEVVPETWCNARGRASKSGGTHSRQANGIVVA